MANKTAGALGFCDDCGKLTYLSRKAAKLVGHRLRPRRNAYECPFYDGFFHVGELPLPIRQGHVSRDEFYGRGEAA